MPIYAENALKTGCFRHFSVIQSTKKPEPGLSRLRLLAKMTSFCSRAVGISTVTPTLDDLDLVLVQNHIQSAAVVPRHHDRSDIVDPANGSLRSDGRRLYDVHPQEPDSHSGLVPLFDHTCRNLHLRPRIDVSVIQCLTDPTVRTDLRPIVFTGQSRIEFLKQRRLMMAQKIRKYYESL